MSTVTLSGPDSSQTLLFELQSLPPFPAAATQLLQLLSQEGFEPTDLVKIVKSDPMFAAELLRMVNSARFARAQEVSGIQHAAALLGRETLKSFATAVSLRLYLGKTIQRESLARVWQHSLATALAAELLVGPEAAAKQRTLKDTAYLGGLLHDIGCLGLMVLHPSEYAEMLATSAASGADVRALEVERFGADHCVVGQWIAESWKFGVEIGTVAMYHHDPMQPQPVTILELVKAGVVLADALGWSSVPQAALTPADAFALLPPEIRQRVKISPEELHASIAERIGMFDQVGTGTAQNARILR